MCGIQDFDVNSGIRESDRSTVERSSARGVERVRRVLQQALADVPEIDVQKVERIRLAIDGQSYRIESARIADRLMQMDGDLAAVIAARGHQGGC